MVNGRQPYKCHACGKQFLGGERRDPKTLFTAYLEGKQTYGQLAERYGCSAKTIQRCLDRAKPARMERFSSVANAVMDTTYFGRRFGVVVFKNSLDGAILLKKYVKNETVKGYVSGIAEIVRRGISENKVDAHALINDMAGKPVMEIDPDDMQRIKESGYSFGFDSSYSMGNREYDYWALAKPMKRILESKIRKVGNGFYGQV